MFFPCDVHKRHYLCCSNHRVIFRNTRFLCWGLGGLFWWNFINLPLLTTSKSISIRLCIAQKSIAFLKSHIVSMDLNLVAWRSKYKKLNYVGMKVVTKKKLEMACIIQFPRTAKLVHFIPIIAAESWASGKNRSIWAYECHPSQVDTSLVHISLFNFLNP